MEPESASIPQLAETHLKKSNVSTPDSASVPDAETVKHTHNTNNSQSEEVSSSELLKGLFTDDFCRVCSAVLLFESQRVSHYEGKKHAQKVRLYLQTKRDEGRMNYDLTVFQQKDGSVDRERFCELCNMVFSSPVVARSHYEGKVHAKNLKKLGLHPAAFTLQQAGNPASQSSPANPSDSLQGSGPQEEGGKEVEKAKEEEKGTQESLAPPTKEVDLSDPNKHCRMCAASFNNPQVAKQHYSGRKHQRNQARLRLLKELEEDGQPGAHLASGTFTCPVCNVTLNSVEMYEAHMQGNKHQQKEMKVADMICKSQRKVYDSFQDELADYIQVQKARGLEPKTQHMAGEGEEEEEEEEEEGKLKEGEPCGGPVGTEQGKSIPPPAFYPPAPWCPPFPPFPPPPLHPGFRLQSTEGPSWGGGFALVPPPFPPGCVPQGFGSQHHSGGWDSGRGHGHGRGRERVRDRGGSRDRSSSDASSTSSDSSSSSSSSSRSSSSDHSRRERRKRRRRKERGSRAKEADSEEEEQQRRKRRKRQRGKSRRNGEGRRDEGHRVKRRREEEGVEQEQVGERCDRNREKDHSQDERKDKVKAERGQAREGKPKHRKEKRTKERTDKEDTRTEEEKLWDESILGLL